MKISYNWLKNYVNTDLPAENIGKLLTDCGLEVESIEKFETIKGGLNGIVIGEVLTKEKHPDADRLNLTTVDIGTGTSLNIVCGASNVEVGQKVVVATIGAHLYPISGESFEIKKSKIRGQLSEGMICAEDEIGLGTSHAGIMVLDADVKIGTPAKDYFKVEEDFIFEIGLTPNRADAASHVGVARDLVAILNLNAEANQTLELPNVNYFAPDNTNSTIEVIVEDAIACPRYSGVSISNITVIDSPEWLKNRLRSIGLRPINNIVDATNFVLHELGQPLHAFDADKIKGNKVIVKTLAEKTKFKTLDEVERELSSEDLMICDANGGMCIAGVFGGMESGVSENTKNIFLESAYFNSTSVRKASKRHALKTDASFRFERGTDPNITVFALKRVALLIKEIAGGEISSEIIDHYPSKIENTKVPFSFQNCENLIGKHIDVETIKTIITSVGIEIEHQGNDALLLSVPPFKVDVHREQDVIEEVLRIYGYNNVEIPTTLKSSLAFAEKPDKEKIQNIISDLLSNNGFSEMMCLSLTKGEYATKLHSLDAGRSVEMMNPLSSDLNVLRQTLLFSGLETIAYNQNRKNADLKIYEFGKTYLAIKGGEAAKYIETRHLSLFITGQKNDENWNKKNDTVNFYTLKGIVEAILERLGIKDVKINETNSDIFSQGLIFNLNKKSVIEFGTVSRSVLKLMDIKQEVFYADFNWDLIIESVKKTKVMYTEVPKFPEVRRDLALLIDKAIQFEQLEQLAYQSEKNMLKNVNLFDVYEGDKLPKGKKSYALSFTLQDENATLTDKQIEKIMEKLMKTYQEKVGAEIR
ncbi:MAG: phenylalanine--tRNA ligase subunit beta [Bacteroidetes bacterium RIFCSPLOWO2_12_FULL_35_15]|nr:MAG: phenylalanine--tRNA ligase subunit beta [Bacteroidetes bacterium RIFCSPLOWO2_12_FULL_35_15]